MLVGKVGMVVKGLWGGKRFGNHQFQVPPGVVASFGGGILSCVGRVWFLDCCKSGSMR